jgi:uncharacterized protein (DUF885 family)
MSKTTLTNIIAVLALLAAHSQPAFAQEADAKLETFFKKYIEEHFQQSPLEATRLGDHRFDHLLDDVSREARAKWVGQTRQTLRELPKQIEYGKLSRPAQIDFDIFKHELATSIWLEENTHPFEEDARSYNGYINDSVYLLLVQSTLPKESNVSNCIARMAQIPQVVAAAKKNLQNPPRPVLETAIRQNRGAISFYERGLFELVGETQQLDALRSAAGRVTAVLKEYQTFLEQDLLPRAKGEWRLGRKKFARKLELVLDAGLSVDQVLADAGAEFVRVENEMYVIARQLWHRHFPKVALPPDDGEGHRATIQRVLQSLSRDHGNVEELVSDARATVERIKTFIREKDILGLPKPDRCQVIEMPEFKRGNALAYLESAPPLDPETASFYAISPPPADWDRQRVQSLLEEYNRPMLQILTIHEAYPGHYVQLEYSNRTRSLIRRVLQSGVFIEGWAVYTEQTMLDQGYGDGDLPLRLSQLKFYLRAVGNAILDHKMHCQAMTDEEALKFLVEGAFQSEGEARLKIVRAKQSSCQLSTYFVGRMAIYRLRQQVERELGEKFELGRFHEAVLDHGSVPVKYLPELVRWRLGRNTSTR